MCTAHALLQQTCTDMFSVECRLSNLQKQNSFQASQPTVACCSASCEYVYLISLATFSLFRAREFSGKAVGELTFFFLCRLWRHKTKMKSLTLLHQSDWTKSCCVLVLLLVVVYFRREYEVWRTRQRTPHFLCGLSLLFRISQVLEHPLFQISSMSCRKSSSKLRRMMLQWLYLRDYGNDSLTRFSKHVSYYSCFGFHFIWSRISDIFSSFLVVQHLPDM